MNPQIIDSDEQNVGLNNENIEKAIERVDKSKMYEDLSTVIICPTRGLFPTKVVQSWMKLQKPLNQLVAGPIFAESMKVDAAYNALIEYILDNDSLNKYRYVLVIESDNLPPSDGLLKLYESMGEYDAVSGLYWGKGNTGFPMIFGNPDESIEMDAKPLKPIQGEVQPCRSMGMGFTLFNLDMFKKLEAPWFKTEQGKDEYGGDVITTQDIYFYRKAGREGYKFAVDNRILVGHYDHKADIVY